MTEQSKYHCLIMPRSSGPHLSQIFTGFAMLQRDGRIKLEQKCLEKFRIDKSKPAHLQYSQRGRLDVLLDGRTRLCYDLHDSHEIDIATAESADFYFKRSYRRQSVPDYLQDKVFPLGLNYFITTDFFDPLALQRAWTYGESRTDTIRNVSKDFIRRIPLVPDSMLMRCTTANIHAPPICSQPPRVIFMARPWNPANFERHSTEAIDALHEINETRARCITMLRREFGKAFTGGFEHTDYAARQYPDVLMQNSELTSKFNYLRLLRQHPICVATTGLHGSIGWKFGEYVALSKAIVSEPLRYTMPGDFSAGRNYLEFATPEQCVEQCRNLYDDEVLRCELMENNCRYYAASLSPDALVISTLKIAAGQRGSA